MAGPESAPSRRQQSSETLLVEAIDSAVLETDSTKLFSQIETAKRAIALRITELSELPSLEGLAGEIVSINRALQVLRLLEEHAPLRKRMVL
jgi:hypothetical protein